MARVERTEVVERIAVRVEDAAEQTVADRHAGLAAGGGDRGRRGDALERAERRQQGVVARDAYYFGRQHEAAVGLLEQAQLADGGVDAGHPHERAVGFGDPADALRRLAAGQRAQQGGCGAVAAIASVAAVVFAGQRASPVSIAAAASPAGFESFGAAKTGCGACSRAIARIGRT